VNVYKEILQENLPKLFSLYNLDKSSSTHGYGDRLCWGWKISDFASGTMQGGVHTLAIAMRLGLIKNTAFGLRVIDSIISAIKKIQHKNGSLEEAFPNENSFCVTALVAFDVLSAIKHLDDRITYEEKNQYLNIVRPLIYFVENHDEKHAVISNHLATAVAAVELWNILAEKKSARGKDLLDVIYRHQSKEGWYKEYEGPDPGYQTLCTYYLFCAYEVTKDERLLESLRQSISFLKYFVHPDGTIGGLYGSRNTEVYYPGGLVALSSISEDFASIAGLLHKGILEGNHVFPVDIDIGNFVPLINAYAVAALYYEKSREEIETPKHSGTYETLFSKNFDHAGIHIHSSGRYYAIVNYKKGGTLKVFDKETNTLDTEDGGIFGTLTSGKWFSTQQLDKMQGFNNHTIDAGFYLINESYPNPGAYVLLRILGLTLFYLTSFREFFKKFIIGMLITKKNKIDGSALRSFEFKDDKIIILERITLPDGCKHIGHPGKCKAIHMASSGYYLKQDQQKPDKSSLVIFKSANGEKSWL
jgi:hypothetical protein